MNECKGDLVFDIVCRDKFSNFLDVKEGHCRSATKTDPIKRF